MKVERISLLCRLAVDNYINAQHMREVSQPATGDERDTVLYVAEPGIPGVRTLL